MVTREDLIAALLRRWTVVTVGGVDGIRERLIDPWQRRGLCEHAADLIIARGLHERARDAEQAIDLWCPGRPSARRPLYFIGPAGLVQIG